MQVGWDVSLARQRGACDCLSTRHLPAPRSIFYPLTFFPTPGKRCPKSSDNCFKSPSSGDTPLELPLGYHTHEALYMHPSQPNI